MCKVVPSKRLNETGGINKESSASNGGSDKSIELTEEQQEYYKLMIECIALEMKVFKDSRRNCKDKEKQQSEDSEIESNNESARAEEVLKEMDQLGLEKEICNEENDQIENDESFRHLMKCYN